MGTRIIGALESGRSFELGSAAELFKRFFAVVDGREALLEARELFLHRAFMVCNVISPRLGAVTKTLLPISARRRSFPPFLISCSYTVYPLSSHSPVLSAPFTISLPFSLTFLSFFFILHLPQCQSALLRGYSAEDRGSSDSAATVSGRV